MYKYLIGDDVFSKFLKFRMLRYYSGTSIKTVAKKSDFKVKLAFHQALTS